MQQVNLLTDELKPNVERLMGGQVLLAWAVFAALLILFTGWQGMSLAFLEDDLVAAQREIDRVAAQNSELKSTVAKDVASLTDDLERLRRERLERVDLVATLSNYKSQRGFAGHLQSLARAHTDGLWLKEIHIDQTSAQSLPQIRLKGEALHAQRIPDYLRNISRDRYFAGQRFDQFQLRVEGDLVEFEFVGPAEQVTVASREAR